MLFTVDEVDPTLDEMVQLAAFYQHFVREGRKVALLMAGLPHNISSLLNNKTVSFLRRSNRRAGGTKRRGGSASCRSCALADKGALRKITPYGSRPRCRQALRPRPHPP